MQVIFLSPDDRFNVRFQAESLSAYPDGAFGTTAAVPVYALRVEGEGQDARSYFLIPGNDNTFYWVAMAHVQIARR